MLHHVTKSVTFNLYRNLYITKIIIQDENKEHTNYRITIVWTISEWYFTYFQSVSNFRSVSPVNPTLRKINSDGPKCSPSGAKCVSLKTVQTIGTNY